MNESLYKTQQNAADRYLWLERHHFDTPENQERASEWVEKMNEHEICKAIGIDE